MILVNELEVLKTVPKSALIQLVAMLAPFAPHLAEHLWEKLGEKESVHQQSWPTGSLTAASEAEVAVQVNGKRRGSITLTINGTEAEAVAEAMKLQTVVNALGGKEPKRIVYVPGKILNLVV